MLPEHKVSSIVWDVSRCSELGRPSFGCFRTVEEASFQTRDQVG